jgi:vacuolar-type H+-ATPase subunit E/Vma4
VQHMLAVAVLGDSSPRAGIVWVALGSGAMLLVVLTAIQTKRPLRLARGGAQTPEGGAQMRRRAEIGAEPVERGEQGFAELGQHVAAILATAREAAEKIEGEARQEAERILAEAREKAAQLEADTAEKRSAAFAAAEDVRTRADAYADKKREEANAQAQDAARAALERQQELHADIERTEERLRKLVANMREVADRLDALVGTDSEALDEALQRQVEAEATTAVQEA